MCNARPRTTSPHDSASDSGSSASLSATRSASDGGSGKQGEVDDHVQADRNPDPASVGSQHFLLAIVAVQPLRVNPGEGDAEDEHHRHDVDEIQQRELLDAAENGFGDTLIDEHGEQRGAEQAGAAAAIEGAQ